MRRSSRRALALMGLVAAPFLVAHSLASDALAQNAAPLRAEPPAAPGLGSLYAVAADCPARDVWLAALRARLPESLYEHAAVSRFPVNIQREGSAGRRYTGELGSVSATTGETRRVQGASCREVVDALTLIASLEIRELASEEQARAAAELERGDDRAASAQPVEPSPVDSSPAAHAAARRDGWQIGATGFAMFQSVTAPGWGTDVGIGLTLRGQAGSLQPWFMLGVYWGADDNPLGGGAAATFERRAAVVVGCPIRFPRDTPAALRPCADLDLGQLKGEGRGVADATQSSALLASAGLALRFEWSVLDRLELGALLGGVMTLSRPRFYFAPELTTLEVAPLGLRSGASASIIF